MKKVFILVLIGVIAINIIGCAQPSLVQSSRDRIISPEVNKTDLENLSNGNNTFAMDLYQALKDSEDNLFYSPYSISSALAMTYAGARGETEKQMADTLHFTLPQDRLHSAFNSVSLALTSRGQETEDQDKKGFILKNVNAIWGQKNYKFQPIFLDVLAENYGAGMRILDFTKEPEKSRLTINNWVSEQTANKIQELLPAGSIDPSIFLVLTNAVYFKANWFHQFDENKTLNGQFNLLNGSKVTVPMMNQTEYFDYAEGNGYQAVELLYRNRALSMVLLLPEQGDFQKFENSLQYSQLKEIIDNLEYRQVILSMPKFRFDSKFNLKQTLSKMGMPIAFSGGADFSGIAEGGGFIDGVYHNAFVAIDEKGTEAGAATAVTIAKGAPGGPVEFTMDRPFIFLIRDIETNTILFIGRVLNPLE
ncbi:MAG: serpin family protein [Dehalococcoidales bacterium]|nr:serpin family protein [Dehalococcoidales bacterium]